MLVRRTPLLIRTRASIVAREAPPLTERLTPEPIVAKFKKAPPELKQPFVVRPFQRDGHVAALQHIENRGMYREELDIERARFPRTSKAVAIHTDGAMSDREFEFAVPPFLVLFRDRHSVMLEQLAEHRRLGGDGWRRLRGTPAPVQAAPTEDHERKLNVLCFPYAVPTRVAPRRIPSMSISSGSRDGTST
jgi:hypothetical protein